MVSAAVQALKKQITKLAKQERNQRWTAELLPRILSELHRVRRRSMTDALWERYYQIY